MMMNQENDTSLRNYNLLCNLKITNMEKVKSIPPYLDNERESKPNNMEKHQFKPFDKVLVRDSNLGLWRANFYSRLDDNNDHVCISGIWNYCIPYNKETAHLIGTNIPYEEPEPKVWNVKNIDTGVHYEFTQNQFEHFIKNSINNEKCCAYSIHRIS